MQRLDVRGHTTLETGLELGKKSQPCLCLKKMNFERKNPGLKSTLRLRKPTQR